jgi:transposase-like protein
VDAAVVRLTIVFRFSWKWRRRSPSKVKERTHEKQRKHYTPEEKVAVLRRHLLEKEPISNLCDEFGLQPRAPRGGRDER